MIAAAATACSHVLRQADQPSPRNRGRSVTTLDHVGSTPLHTLWSARSDFVRDGLIFYARLFVVKKVLDFKGIEEMNNMIPRDFEILELYQLSGSYKRVWDLFPGTATAYRRVRELTRRGYIRYVESVPNDSGCGRPIDVFRTSVQGLELLKEFVRSKRHR